MKKRSAIELIVAVIVAAVLLGAVAGGYFVTVGVSARPQPGAAETFVARTVRSAAIGWHASHQPNPVAKTDAVLAEARAHFADHCASCHGNDGEGDTEMGRGLYPRAPDMRLPATQQLADHQLFYIIENGIRLTGMPAWSTGTKAGEEASWKLVHFIRHLPQMTEAEIDEMKALNPRSPEEIRQEIAAEQFLSGADPSPAAPESHEHGGGHE